MVSVLIDIGWYRLLGAEYVALPLRQRENEPTTYIAHLGRNSLAAWNCFRWHEGTKMEDVLRVEGTAGLLDEIITQTAKVDIGDEEESSGPNMPERGHRTEPDGHAIQCQSQSTQKGVEGVCLE